MSLDADVIVIGAGPAGCAAAIRLVDAGYKVIALERKEREDGEDITSGEVMVVPTHNPQAPLQSRLRRRPNSSQVYRRSSGLKGFHRMSELLGYRFGQAGQQFVTVLIVNPYPARFVPTVMEAVRAGRQPQLLHLRLSRQDKLRTGRELNRHDAVGRRVVHFVGIEILEPLGNLAQRGIGALDKFSVIHAAIVSNHGTEAAEAIGRK